MSVDTNQIRQELLQDGAVTDAIRRRAYHISVERGFSEPHHLLDDWFRAENEILNVLVEQEVRRHQGIAAAVTETAMAEESIPTVITEPQPAAQPKKAAAKKTAKAEPKAEPAKTEATDEKPAAKKAPAKKSTKSKK